MIIKLNEFAKEVHQNAVDKGFYEKEPELQTVFALIHSELSEALEEYRNGRPLVYVDRLDTLERITNANAFQSDDQPEGIAVELTDVIIRILDTAAYHEVDIDGSICDNELFREAFLQMKGRKFPSFVNELHDTVSMASMETKGGNLMPTTFDTSSAFYTLAYVILLIKRWMDKNGIELEAMLHMKHDYNKTRPYLHGGKVC